MLFFSGILLSATPNLGLGVSWPRRWGVRTTMLAVVVEHGEFGHFLAQHAFAVVKFSPGVDYGGKVRLIHCSFAFAGEMPCAAIHRSRVLIAAALP